jgi:anti-sigma regulatory factor (Ser/Thr protein kinase)
MNERRTSVPSEAAQLPVLANFLHEFWSAAELPPAQSLPFEIALEEIFMNVVAHGTPAGCQNRVEIVPDLSEDNLTLAVEERARHSTHFSVQAPDLARLKIGKSVAWGSTVRQMMDVVITRAWVHAIGCMSKHVTR